MRRGTRSSVLVSACSRPMTRMWRALLIATAVQAVPDGFAEQGRHRTDATECSEAGLGTHALGTVASEAQAEKVDDFGCFKIAEVKATGAKSRREIAGGLNAAVVRTLRGGTWSATHVMRFDAANCGLI